MTGETFTENHNSLSIPRSKSRLDTILKSKISITWERILIVGLLLAALITRLWNLGARVMSHDESLHVYYSWLLATGRSYEHNPMMHGPFLFESTALMNLLFGASDFTSRLVPALVGIFIVVAIPILLKPWLGLKGVLAASTLLLISPYILYYSRYIRHVIQVIAWTLMAGVAILRYLKGRCSRDLVLLAASLALMFATMEITFIYLVIFSSFLTIKSLANNKLAWVNWRSSAEFDLLIVISTLGAFFSAPIALLVINPLLMRLSGLPYVALQALESQSMAWASGQTGLRLLLLWAVFATAASAVGLWWNWKRWLKLFGVFVTITILLFTTFITNPGGLASGLIGSLGYWLSQHEVQRGSQPWYFYLLVFPLYEYLPVLVGILSAAYFGLRRKVLSPSSQQFVPFLFWWGVGIWVALSIAGEKMPWLSTHITIPFILLAGWGIGQLLEGEWNLSRWIKTLGRTAAVSLIGGLALLTLRTSLMVNYVYYDYTTEFIGYAHGAPGVKEALDDIEMIGRRTGAGRELKVAYDDSVSWPMTWYLRNFPNQTFYGAQPNRQMLDAPVVIAGPKNWAKVEAILGGRYQRYELIRLWWPMEDYKDLSLERLRFAISDPDMRTAVWNILWARDYTLYAEMTGQSLDPPTGCPLAERMRVYVENETARHLDNYRMQASRIEDLPEPVDAYASVRVSVLPENLLYPGLNSPRGLAVAPDGSIYVADSGNSRVVKLDKDGNLLFALGESAPQDLSLRAPATFNEPWGIAVESLGNVYVADTWNHRIQKFDASGKFLLEWGSPGLSSEAPDLFWGPRGITVSKDGRVYVADTGNKRVAVFDSQGAFLFNFLNEGEAALDEPVGLALDSQENVYVADTWNSRVAIFSSEGEYLKSWSFSGWTSLSLENKPYLAVDDQDRVYLTDPEGYRTCFLSLRRGPGSFWPIRTGRGCLFITGRSSDGRRWGFVDNGCWE